MVLNPSLLPPWPEPPRGKGLPLLERRRAERWPVAWPLEGWLELIGAQEGPIPVILTDFSAAGIGVLLRSRHRITPGERGDLISQAHGAGCSQRLVRCCWQRLDPRHPQLQRLGLSLDRRDW